MQHIALKFLLQVFGKLISERQAGQFHDYGLHASNRFGFQGYAEHLASMLRCFSMFTVYVLNRVSVEFTRHFNARIVSANQFKVQNSSGSMCN